MSAAGEPLAELARRGDEPAFAAPWEATAFALRAHLVERGVVDAGRFAALLGEELSTGHPPADDGTAYFAAFVTALERCVAEIAAPDALGVERARWREAARTTPHGQPIQLPR
ncbi:nitrile hydratase accessory protein [Acuticoccus sp.]|uniref:nitrile hydratase accessory protein n=1 Tax=Acuticoccus sp. TaxID=1904378 RepID=UPI003B515834